jgi:hypothetical protein
MKRIRQDRPTYEQVAADAIDVYEAELIADLAQMLKSIQEASASTHNAIRVGQLRGLIAALGLEPKP